MLRAPVTTLLRVLCRPACLPVPVERPEELLVASACRMGTLSRVALLLLPLCPLLVVRTKCACQGASPSLVAFCTPSESLMLVCSSIGALALSSPPLYFLPSVESCSLSLLTHSRVLPFC